MYNVGADYTQPSLRPLQSSESHAHDNVGIFSVTASGFALSHAKYIIYAGRQGVTMLIARAPDRNS